MRPTAAHPEGKFGLAAIPALIQALKVSDVRGRMAAAIALWRIGDELKSLVPLLIEVTHDRHPHTVLAAFTKIGPILVPDLVQALQVRDVAVRQAAAFALGYIGPEADTAIPALVEALREEDGKVRWAAARALCSIDPEMRSTRAPFIDALDDTDARVRMVAAEMLGRLGPRADAAVGHLVGALKDPDVGVRMTAIRALCAIGPAARTAAPSLFRSLDDEDVGVRMMARGALAEFYPGVKFKVRVLRDKLAGGKRRGRNAGATQRRHPAEAPSRPREVQP